MITALRGRRLAGGRDELRIGPPTVTSTSGLGGDPPGRQGTATSRATATARRSGSSTLISPRLYCADFDRRYRAGQVSVAYGLITQVNGALGCGIRASWMVGSGAVPLLARSARCDARRSFPSSLMVGSGAVPLLARYARCDARRSFPSALMVGSGAVPLLARSARCDARRPGPSEAFTAPGPAGSAGRGCRDPVAW